MAWQPATPVPSEEAVDGHNSKVHDLHYLQELYRQREREVEETKGKSKSDRQRGLVGGLGVQG